VNRVVAHEELMPFTRRLAAQIAGTPAVGEVLALYEHGEDLGGWCFSRVAVHWVR
jgi:hypothetical protein